eukprot:CAMPEP_0195018058 /NCGR_PEP_ID=MMETSP0326_2-20130528/29297_1 /TAXON_ID=2866 ORGANISM="Crypthecodinium cohnii, Strain Seligo" /NCGR_SAMPLE_ID=MMETSP0326_2 /ASSEMBLY_ACC=CAM_ASM_000348 /LENGTH=38 /DNA_ID= /DNA_START= /DNA_END= /DNA_ORIENTATION=
MAGGKKLEISGKFGSEDGGNFLAVSPSRAEAESSPAQT